MSSPVFKQLLNKAKFTRIRKFSKPHMYYSDSCGQGINHSGERFQNKAVSGNGFNFFRVGGRPILVKKKSMWFQKHPASCGGDLWPWPNVEVFMRRTKLRQLRS